MIDKKIDEALDGVIFESRTPKVGIFWVHGKELISFNQEIREVQPVAGFRDSDYAHYSEWDRLRIPGDYTDVPRGRVVQDVKNDRFIVYVPSFLASDKPVLIRIFREFSLPTSKITVTTDAHYEMGTDPFDEFEDD